MKKEELIKIADGVCEHNKCAAVFIAEDGTCFYVNNGNDFRNHLNSVKCKGYFYASGNANQSLSELNDEAWLAFNSKEGREAIEKLAGMKYRHSVLTVASLIAKAVEQAKQSGKTSKAEVKKETGKQDLPDNENEEDEEGDDETDLGDDDKQPEKNNMPKFQSPPPPPPAKTELKNNGNKSKEANPAGGKNK